MKKGWTYSGLLIFFINLLLFISCRKEAENEIPVITINSPAAQSSYNVYDTVIIHAVVTDDNLITRVVVQLKDENNIPVLSKQVTVNKASYELQMEFPLDEPNLDGSYYFDIRAYDADNFASAFRFINVGGIAKNIEKIFLITEGSANTEISELVLHDVVSRNILSGDFLASAMDEDRGILYSIGEFNGDLVAMDTAGMELWKFQSGKLPQVPFFTDLYFDGKVIYCALNDGRILGFDDKGNKVFEKVLQSGFAPFQMLIHEDRMIYEKIEKNSGKVFLMNNFHPSGMLRNELLFNYGRIVDLFSMNWNKVLILSNSVSGPYILEYHTEDFFLTKIYFDKDSPLFNCAVRIDDNTLVISKGNDLMKYFIEQRLLVPFKKSFMPGTMRYNAIEDVIYCAIGDALVQIDAITGNELNRVQTNKNIDSFELYSAF